MGDIHTGPEKTDPLVVAAEAFRATCALHRKLMDPEKFAEAPEIQTTDTAVQALYIECVRRNAGIPHEIAEACVHVLAMIVAQQPDPVFASEITMGNMLQHVLRFRRDMAAQDAAAAQAAERKPS